MRTAASTTLLATLLALAGCTGGLHHQGEQQITLHGSWGTPITGNGIYPEGDGSAENWGATLGYGYFVQDRVAFKVDVTPYREYHTFEGNTTAGELQIGFRWHFAELPLGDRQLGLFAEIYGGLMHSSRSFPEGGAHTNFTQDTGLGFELPLDDKVSWFGGYRYRHISHGHVFGGDPNPSQNDNQFFTGLSFSW